MISVYRDEDIKDIPFILAIETMQTFFQSAKQGGVLSPPRHSVCTEQGGLTFTIGAEVERSNSIGFRVYDTYPNSTGTNSDQIVAVYDTQKSHCKGIVIGSLLGVLRTAAINAVAIQKMAVEKTDCICLLGAGFHAYYQLKAALSVRSVKTVLIYNRNEGKARQLIARVKQEYSPSIDFKYIKDIECVVRQADILLCATSASQPFFDCQWLKPNAYISSIGPKFIDQHELPKEIALHAQLLVSDAPQQIQHYQRPYFLENCDAINALDDISAPLKQGIRVFLSSGRSGSEVMLADAMIQYLGRQQLCIGVD